MTVAVKKRAPQGTKHVVVPVKDFKFDQKTGRFTCYGNVKNYIDHADERTVDGCFLSSCVSHKSNGTMPKMFWMHNPYSIPVGVWHDMEEDEVGLKLEGSNLPTTVGKDIQIAAENGALDSFSIGYNIIREEYNHDLKCWDLLELEIVEVSWVTYACNDKSTLIEMKAKMEDTGILTKRDLEKHLRDTGFSRKQANTICSRYDDKDNEPLETKAEDLDIFSQFAIIESS